MTFCTLAMLFAPTVAALVVLAGWAYGKFLEQGEINGVRRPGKQSEDR